MGNAKSGVKLDKAAFRALRKHPKVRADLKRRAQAIAAAASKNGQVSGYKVTELLLEDPRGAVSVMATGHARAHDRKHNSLIKALDVGRD